MILSELKKIIENPETLPIVSGSIVTTEMAVERYFNRLYLIALRLKGLNYNQATEVVKGQLNEVNQIFAVTMTTLLGEKRYEEFIRNHGSIQGMKRLFENYSVPKRNRLMHGKAGSFGDKAIKLCIMINVNYMREVEKYLKKEFGHSVFDSPKDWGAKTIRTTLSDSELVKYRLKKHKEFNDEKASRELSGINFRCSAFKLD